MKNLCVSAASALCALAAPALASEPLTLKVGGYMAAGVGYIEEAGSDNGDFGVMRDGEIHFDVRGEADNGLAFRARVELEAFTTTDQIDENWVSVGGSWGEIMIGANDTAKTQMALGVLYPAPDKLGYYDSEAPQGLMGGMDAGDDNVSVNYYSPDLYGFQFGLTYQPSADSDGLNDSNTLVTGDAELFAAGLSYMGSFEEVDLGLSLGVASSEQFGEREETYSFGGQVGYAGFTVVSYIEQNFDESWDYSAGLAYETGPWTFAGGWSQSGYQTVEDVNTYAGWVSYAVAPGVLTTAGVSYSEGGNVDTGVNGEDGLVAMTWVTLNF